MSEDKSDPKPVVPSYYDFNGFPAVIIGPGYFPKIMFPGKPDWETYYEPWTFREDAERIDKAAFDKLLAKIQNAPPVPTFEEKEAAKAKSVGGIAVDSNED